MSSPVLLDRQGGVSLLTLNRPDRANVIDAESSEALMAAVDELAGDAAVRVVLIRARGPHFCAGGNIHELARAGGGLAAQLDARLPMLHRAIHRLATLEVPVISALNGPVGGGGIGLALTADIVVAADSMKLRGGYSAIGLTPDVGTSWLLARRVGEARATEIFLTNEALSAHRCLQLGIVSEVVPAAQLEGRTLQLAEALAKAATRTLGRTKRLLRGVLQRSLGDQLALEKDLMVESARGTEAAEGVSAFIDRRTPDFERP